MTRAHGAVARRALNVANAMVTRCRAPGDGDRSLGALLRDCLAQAADLHTRNQDYAEAQRLRQLAATITG